MADIHPFLYLCPLLATIRLVGTGSSGYVWYLFSTSSRFTQCCFRASAGLVGGLVLTCLWMVILRLFAGLMVWLSVIASNLLFIACTIFCFSKAGLMASHGGEVGKVCVSIIIMENLLGFEDIKGLRRQD